MDSLKDQLKPYLSSKDLIKNLTVLPTYDRNARSTEERLNALFSVYGLFIPNDSTVLLYNHLYFAVLNSLSKKNSILERKLLNDNYKGLKRYGVIGGLDSFEVIGSAGIGKTSAIERTIDLIAKDGLLVSKTPFKKIIPILLVECVADGSFKGLLYSILKEIDLKLGSNYFEVNNRATMNVDRLLSLVSNILINHVCVLVIDEIERVANETKRGETLINYLTQLVNQSNVCIVFVGNERANLYFQTKEYLSRRTIGLTMKKMEYGIHFNNFCRVLFGYQYTDNKVEYNTEYSKVLYSLTNGIVSMIVSLFVETQKYAIINGIKEISPDLFKLVFINNFGNMTPYIDSCEVKFQKIKENNFIGSTSRDEFVIYKTFLNSNKDADKAIAELSKITNVEEIDYGS